MEASFGRGRVGRDGPFGVAAVARLGAFRAGRDRVGAEHSHGQYRQKSKPRDDRPADERAARRARNHVTVGVAEVAVVVTSECRGTELDEWGASIRDGIWVVAFGSRAHAPNEKR